MEWTVGQRVAVYGPYDREPIEIATIEKIHKTGHIVVKGVRYRPGGHGHAHQTGDGYRRGFLRSLTPDVEREAIRATKRRRQQRLAKWLAEADPDAVPDAVLGLLLEARNAATPSSQ